ncbi:MAG: hypothetical protein Hens3KO_20310 [Henriciella sp.]
MFVWARFIRWFYRNLRQDYSNGEKSVVSSEIRLAGTIGAWIEDRLKKMGTSVRNG